MFFLIFYISVEFITFSAFLLNEKRMFTFIKRFFLVLGDYYEILKEKGNHCMEWKVALPGLGR